MAEYEDGLGFLVENDLWFATRRVDGTRFFDHFWMGRQMLTQVVYYFTSYTHMKDYCYGRFPKQEGVAQTPWFYDHCALAHTNEKSNPDLIPQQTFFGLD